MHPPKSYCPLVADKYLPVASAYVVWMSGLRGLRRGRLKKPMGGNPPAKDVVMQALWSNWRQGKEHLLL